MSKLDKTPKCMVTKVAPYLTITLVVYSVTRKNRQMAIKVAQKWLILTPVQKLPKNVGDLSKLIVTKGFKKTCPNSNQSPKLVTLVVWKINFYYTEAASKKDFSSARSKQRFREWMKIKKLPEVDFVGVLSDNLQLDVLGLSLKQDGKKKVLNCPSVEIRFIQTKLKAWISVCSDKI